MAHDYLALLQRFPPRPIQSPEDCQQMQAVIDSLVDKPILTDAERDYLNVLGSLMYEYEHRHPPVIPDLAGVELLRALISDGGVKQKDLIPIFKTASIVSEVLAGKRSLTVEHIQGLATFFQISPAAFFPTN